MANNFATDASVKALYNFESGALGTDSGPVGTNTLTLRNTPTADTTHYKQGAAGVALAAASHQYLDITNANLSTGFPFKSGDTTKLLTVCAWVYANSLSGWNGLLGMLSYAGADNSGWGLEFNGTTLYAMWNGSDISTGLTLTTGYWYHITLWMDGVNKSLKVKVIKDSDGSVQYWTNTPSAVQNVGTLPFRIGTYTNKDSSNTFDGTIDEVVVCNRLLNHLEALQIKGGTYNGPATWNGWCVDPINGSNTTGDGVTWATAKKTVYSITAAPGETILIAKSPEVAQSGTATATTGSLSVTGISGWTPATGNIIRFVGDNTLYTVRSYSSGTITLYRPYRGQTGSKTINLLTTFTPVAYTDLNTSSGVLGNPIIVSGGINTSNDSQDGFSIWNAGSSWVWGGFTWCNVSNIGVTAGGLSYQNFFSQNSNFTNIFFLWATTTGYNAHRYQNCRVTNLYIDGGIYWATCQGLTVTNVDGANPASFVLGFYSAVGVRFVNPRIFGYAGYAAVYSSGGQNSLCSDMEFINLVFDEGKTGAPVLFLNGYNQHNIKGLKFINPTCYGPQIQYDTYCQFGGDVLFSKVNGLENYYRHIGQSVPSGISSSGPSAISFRDNLVYHTASPSECALSVNSLIPQYAPFTQRFYVPCDAGIQKTISVWVMKNSNPLGTITINTAGSGYAIGDLIQGPGSSILQVATLSGSGVASLNIISYGYNCSVANGISTITITGGGSGCKINVTAIGTGYGSTTLPILRVTYPTGSAGSLTYNVAESTMTDVNNSWQQLSCTVTPSVQDGIAVDVILQSFNVGAQAWIDDFGVA